MQQRAIAEGRLLAAYDGRRLVAMARINAFKQWWHGAAMPMAGIGGVVVAPEYRGSGVGRQLMTAVLGRAADHGYPLSCFALSEQGEKDLAALTKAFEGA